VGDKSSRVDAFRNWPRRACRVISAKSTPAETDSPEQSSNHRQPFASLKIDCRDVQQFLLHFAATGVRNRHAPTERGKDFQKTTMTNVEASSTENAATVAEQGAHIAPKKVSPKNGAGQKKGAHKGQKIAKGKARIAKKVLKAGNKIKPAESKRASTPQVQSKSAKILELIGRTKGAGLAEIMKTTGWQAHSVRGFLSTAAKKHGLKVESTKSASGDRVYRIGK
jgi:hypothetical protein